MGLGFEVRVATYDDIDAIAKITSEAFVKYAQLIGMPTTAALNETAEDIKKDIDENMILVAFVDGVPVGSVRVKVDIEEKSAYLERFEHFIEAFNGYLEDVERKSPRELYIGHLNVVVIDENIAKDSLYDIIEALFRNPETLKK